MVYKISTQIEKCLWIEIAFISIWVLKQIKLIYSRINLTFKFIAVWYWNPELNKLLFQSYVIIEP